MSTKTVYGTIDAFTNQDHPTVNHGADSRLMLKGQTSHKKYGYVLFAQPFPDGAIILSASMAVTLASAWPGTTVITVRRVTATWAESKITWNNQPATTATHEATRSVSNSNLDAEITIDLTDMIADVSAGAAWYGVRVEINVDGPLYLWASEAVGRPAPRLDLEWVVEADSVTDLHPMDGAVVGSVNPVMTWTFRDADGTSDQASSEVEVDTTDDFASPVYASGMVTNSEQQWQIPSGLSDEGDYYWRVRVTDTNGNVSDWSDVGGFHVTTKAVLTISSPSTTPGETTPPVTWSLASGTQVAYRVILRDLVAPTVSGAAAVIWDTGRVASTSTTIAMPPGLLTRLDSNAYELEVDVWDDSDRTSTPGLSAYSVATRLLTLVPSGAPGDVSTLTAADDEPAVALTWTRSVVPDFFCIRIDGEVPAGVDENGNTWDRLEPADYLVSGTTYTLEWFRSAPSVEHTYEVVSVVISGGVATMSTNGPTVVFTPNPVGLWLVDESSGLEVRFEGRDDPSSSWKIGEESSDFYPIGRRSPVHIVTSLRGYEGSMGGLYLGDTGAGSGEMTAEDWRDAFEDLKGSGSNRIRLIVQGYNFPVQISDVVIAPRHPDGYSASFSFAQTDEFSVSIGGQLG